MTTTEEHHMDLHYELTDTTITIAGHTLHRIRATRDLPAHGVRAGDLGGYVEFTGNLSDNAWVYGNARVYGGARVFERHHVQTVSPIGSEGVTATLHRTVTGHALHVGCWTGGTVDTLAAEVERRARRWKGSDAEIAAWRAQYVALEALCRATISTWATEEATR